MSAEFNLDTLQIGAKIPAGKCSGTVKVEQSVDIHYNGYDNNGVMRLLSYDLQPAEIECEIIETGVYVRGNILAQAFGVNICEEEEDTLWSAKEYLPYETVLKCDNCQLLSNPLCKAAARITSADVKVSDREKLTVAANVVVTVKAYDWCEKNIVVGAGEDDCLRTKSESMPFTVFEGQYKDSTEVEDKLVLPQAKPAIDKIVMSKYNPGSYNVKQNNDMFDVNGEVNVCIVYVADETADVDELLQCCEFAVPFSFSVAADGMADGVECVPSILINGVNVDRAEDEDGEYREVDVQMSISVCIDCFGKIVADIVKDVFCIGQRVKLEKEVLATDSVEEKYAGNIPCIKGVEIDVETMGDPQFVLMSNGRIRDCAFMFKEEKPILSGMAEARVVYSVKNNEGDNEYKSMLVELPFQQELEGCSVDAKTDYSHNVRVENCRSIMTMGNVLETKLDVAYEVEGCCINELEIPVGVMEDTNSGTAVATWMNADDEIVMYVVKENEDVWDIAKRFLVAPENILNIDGEQVEDSVIAGSRVFIV